MSSSGLIYAVIVGAWAAYLVPMWLRRQDELNEARPTERFSTAIRLLSGKGAMERRYAKDAERRAADGSGADGPSGDGGSEDAGGSEGTGGSAPSGDDDAGERSPDAAENAVDVRAFADPKTMVGGAGEEAPTEILQPGADGARQQHEDGDRRAAREQREQREAREQREQREAREQHERRQKRARVLARRRRTTMVLFLAFTCGSVAAAVGGLGLLWVPGVPAALLTAYIVHLRAQERRRFAVTMDRRQAEAAAQRLHERRSRRPAAPQDSEADRPTQEHELPPRTNGRTGGRPSARPASSGGRPGASGGRPVADAGGPGPESGQHEAGAADRRALVEQTDHAEWVDQQRGRDRDHSDGEGWDPVPVPLPTYVSAPVAPRSTRGVDLEAPDTWSSARSSAAGAEPAQPGQRQGRPAEQAEEDAAPRPRRTRDRGRTPLFDQYENEDRPRAANE